MIEIDAPTVSDGLGMWRAAIAAEGLDVNSAYAYVLWARDFADTTAVARHEGEVVAFCTGYRRPSEPSTLFVWQVAVRPDHRRQGLARRLLDALVDRMPDLTVIEATVTSSNAASLALFDALAMDHGGPSQVSALFGPDSLPADHEPEDLVRVMLG